MITEFNGRQIFTQYVKPPIPVRHCDWVAFFDEDESPWRGWGATEEDAVAELVALAEEDASEHLRHVPPAAPFDPNLCTGCNRQVWTFNDLCDKCYDPIVERVR